MIPTCGIHITWVNKVSGLIKMDVNVPCSHRAYYKTKIDDKNCVEIFMYRLLKFSTLITCHSCLPLPNPPME